MIEHPLISNIDHLSVEELQTKINELTKKLGMAHRFGNAMLVQQVRMALDTYTMKYQEKTRELWQQKNNKGPDFSDKIDIS